MKKQPRNDGNTRIPEDGRASNERVFSTVFEPRVNTLKDSELEPRIDDPIRKI